MFDKSWAVFMTPGTSGPVAAPSVDIGRPDTNEELLMNLSASGVSALVFNGRWSTQDCQSFINTMGGNAQVNRGDDLLALVAGGGYVELALADDVRQFTVYFTGSYNPGNANQAVGVNVRVHG